MEVTLERTINYEVINDEWKLSVLEGTGIFMTDLKFRLLIPQDHFMYLQILDNLKGLFTVTWYKSVLNIYDQVPITVSYEHATHLNMIHAYKRIYSTA